MSNKFYEWWKNHRKVVTYGAFIILFGFYLSPVVQEAKYKNQCIKYSTKGALTKFNKDDIGETLLNEPSIRDLFQEELSIYGKNFKSFEHPENFALLSEEWSIENGLLTPTLKLKRDVVEKKFKDQIESLYSE